MRRACLALLLLATPTALAAASLTVTKSLRPLSDPLGLLRPRVLPGAEVEVALTVANPLANLLKPVRGVTIADDLPAAMVLRVADFAPGTPGPVEFADGDLLGLGLTDSNLSYTYRGLGATNDGLEFSDGTSWSYLPVPDAAGFDAKVRAIRVTLGGTQATESRFRLRYRARVK